MSDVIMHLTFTNLRYYAHDVFFFFYYDNQLNYILSRGISEIQHCTLIRFGTYERHYSFYKWSQSTLILTVSSKSQ